MGCKNKTYTITENAGDKDHDIMIHGLPNGWGFLRNIHRLWDWTDGCIAVTDEEMRDIWARVPNHAPIEIMP